jgi:hypothetical protein
MPADARKTLQFVRVLPNCSGAELAAIYAGWKELRHAVDCELEERDEQASIYAAWKDKPLTR